jgi:hypothetical protein
MSEQMMSAREIAALLGIGVGSWQSLVRQGYAPQAESAGRSPSGQRCNLWRRSTVETFIRNRKGAGFRSDLRKPA